MPKSLRCKIKKLCYDGVLTEKERDRIIKALDNEDVLMDLPPLIHQRKKGKWIKVDPLGIGDEAYMCSECETGDWDVTIGEYKFCPYCGAEMSGGDEDEASD